MNDILNYGLGGREAGGQAGINCGKSEGKGTNGAGRAYAKCTNGFEIVAGGGGGRSESGNKGGDAEGNGEGKYGGKGATIYGGGERGDPDESKTGYNYAKNGIKDKGGKGGYSKEYGKWCGGGGGDGYYGGGGGCFGEKDNDGGGGGGSNYYSNNVENPNKDLNKESNYAGIKISIIIKY